MTNKTLKVAVSGIGWCGCEHIKAFQRIPGCEIAQLHGRNPSRVWENLKTYGLPDLNVPITTSFEDIVNNPEIDVVSIAGINSTHTPYAIAAASAGKHLMIEKPVARDPEELQALLEAVDRAGVETVVSFELYWNPLFRVARWLQESGRLGRTIFVRSNYHSRVGEFYSGWDWCRTKEEGRSMLLNAGCHSLDAVRQFAGTPLRRVSAFQTTGLPQGYEYPTTIQVNLEFAEGILGQVSASADVATPYHFGLEIYGTQATLSNQYLRWAADCPLEVSELESSCPVPDVRFFLEPYSETQKQIRIECVLPNSVRVEHHPFHDEALSLVEAIRTGSPSPLNLATAALTHRMAYAADLSAAQGGQPIDV